ncbi:carotenoid biosynthesis protein [Phytohabitans suffuscus]|uniref:carotenoid biosynthesis protein n=1 Tax=Phytohabitans suffuscus TaxID=624315 RepID=UPI001563E796|nr:carotenoid biosynthesis protein [Phytohabitans suffuscus]
MSRHLPWALLGGLVLVQISYPLTGGGARAAVTVATVVLGYTASVSHALLTRGPRAATLLVVVTTGGGFAVEALGVATGFPFGAYTYSGDLGPRLAGVAWVVPLAWTWMAWPAWLAAVRVTRSRPGRVVLAALGLAAWDLFLDPQMVAEGYWTWRDPHPALPGVPGVPAGNYLGWLAVALLMALLIRSAATGPGPDDAPMYALYLWTYAASVVAHAVFLDLPGLGSALWGAFGMGLLAAPLAWSLRQEPP